MLITLNEWAGQTFGGTKPSVRTMRRWASEGKFHPAAKKVGRALFVESTATYKGPTRAELSKSLEKARALK